MDVQKIKSYEAMAKLQLDDDTRERVVNAFSVLTCSFKKLSYVDTNAVEPLVTVLDMQNVLRKDISSKFITRDELLSNAVEEFDGYFQVPKTLE